MISKSYLPRQFDREGVAGHESAGGRRCPCGERGDNIVQHGLRQFGARRLIEHCGEPLLGRRQILDRNEDHGWSEAARAAAGRNGLSELVRQACRLS